jgi:hypothetical protein
MRAHYITIALLYLLPLLAAPAQTTATPTSWQALSKLPTGIKLHIKADHHHGRTCKLDHIDEQQLTCMAGTDGKQLATIPRSDIQLIKLTRHGRSAWVGAGIGFVAGSAAGDIAAHHYEGGYDGLAAATGGIFVGGIGAIVGTWTDLARGPVVYRRP